MTRPSNSRAMTSRVSLACISLIVASSLVPACQAWFAMRPTRGEPIPKPKSQSDYPHAAKLTILPYQFEIVDINQSCDVLQAAVKRYFEMIREGESPGGGWPLNLGAEEKQKCGKGNGPVINRLLVDVALPCKDGEFPNEATDESYSIEVTEFGALIEARQVWGALRGMETFSQLVYTDADTGCLTVAQTHIEDGPRFKHRGFMLDTSRHFLTKRVILRHLDAMSFAKYNVFHWHIVDDESFPYASTSIPELTIKGAFSSRHVYSQADVAEIIEYARLRGIRVIPEFDSPGHTWAWGNGLPDLLTKCYSSGKPNGKVGPVDPTQPGTFDAMTKLAKELRTVFKDDFIHLGGDEVSFSCWQSNPHITAFMKKNNVTSYPMLESYYIKKVQDIFTKLKAKVILWEDPFDHAEVFPNDTIAQVWLGGWEKRLDSITKKGFRTILSSCWYLNYVANPYDWTYMQNYYACDPGNFNGTQTQRDLVLGGEACMWGEYTDSSNVLTNTWPLAFIPAERLWSPASTKDFNTFIPRLYEMQCRLNHRGVPNAPVAGPGSCDKIWDGL